MTGVAYKEIVINDICHYKVQPNIIVRLALLFRYSIIYSIYLLYITPTYAYIYCPFYV